MKIGVCAPPEMLPLLESLGFQRDGIVRRCVRGWKDTVFDDCLYSLLREEFL